MMSHPIASIVTLLLLSSAAAACAGRAATGRLADALADTTQVFASDDDPALIREASPFALKTMEAVLAERPRHRPLLLSTCRAFTEYAFAFVLEDAERAADDDRLVDAAELRDRARRLFVRARGYCLRRLELDHPALRERLMVDAAAAVAAVRDVEALYWTAASWGSAIAAGRDRPELVADAPAVRALLERALVLDASYGDGAIYEALIPIAANDTSAGAADEARRHFERAVAMSRGRSAWPYVWLASTVSVRTQARAEFVRLLEEALAFDVDAVPSRRLMNLVAQARARRLLARVDELFAGQTPRPAAPGTREEAP